jgi:uracil-DNA glycosylase
MIISKSAELNSLSIRIAQKECPRCPRMKSCLPVFSMNDKDFKKKIIFIAEAPGRFGAEISRIPMIGDHSGNNFEEFISTINLSRSNFYITNAVLCLPLDKEGNNNTPTDGEIKNCSKFLSEQIELIKPEIIITLGSSALKSLNYIQKHSFTLKKDVGVLRLWNGYDLLPLYHTSPKVLNMYRSKEKQFQDYKVLGELLKEKNLLEC